MNKLKLKYKINNFLRIVFFIQILNIKNFSIANNQDSLKILLNSAKEDTSKYKIAIKLGKSYLFSNPDSSITFFDYCYSLGDKLKQVEKKTESIYLKGWAIHQKGNYEESEIYLRKALRMIELFNDGKINSSKELKSQEAIIYGLIGLNYEIKSNYSKALECHLKALKINEELNSKAYIAKNYSNIGNVFAEINEKDKALFYYKKALKINVEIGNKSSESINLGNIGIIFQEQNKIDSAYIYYLKALSIEKEFNNLRGIARNLNQIGLVKEKNGKYHEAIDYFNEATNTIKHIDKTYISQYLLNTGRCYLLLNQIEKSEKYLLEAKNILQNSNLKNLEYVELCKLLADLYLAKKNYLKAYDFLNQHHKIKDSLFRDEKQKEIFIKEMKFDFDKKSIADSIEYVKKNEIKNALIQKQKSELKARKYLQYGLFGGIIVLITFIYLIYNRYKFSQQQRFILDKQKSIVEEQKKIVELKNKEILQSITYAKRIQTAILPPPRIVKEFFENSFILYLPKDIVAGDFYWMENIDNNIYFAACDCTGHGVPGAMVSVVCNTALNRSVNEFGERMPGKILDRTRELVLENFVKSDEEVKDGMDASLGMLDASNKKLYWAGANNPLWIYRNVRNVIEEIKADKQPIGKTDAPKPFTTQEIELNEGDIIYLFTDGYADQFGGTQNRKLTKAKFREQLLFIATKDMNEQRELLLQFHDEYKGKEQQIDDICVIGVRV